MDYQKMGKKVTSDVENIPKTNQNISPRPLFIDLGTLFSESPVDLGFLRNINVSFWQTYSKPTSSNVLVSSGFSATFAVKLSFPESKSVCSTFIYSSVFCILSCPKISFTYHRSLVLCCSVVALLCLAHFFSTP